MQTENGYNQNSNPDNYSVIYQQKAILNNTTISVIKRK